MVPASHLMNELMELKCRAMPAIPVAKHPGGKEYLARVDRALTVREQRRAHVRALLDPYLAYPLAAALTQLILG